VATGRFWEAEQTYRDGLACSEKALAGAPKSFPYRYILGNNRNGLGWALHRTGRPAEAEKAYRQALDVWEKLLVADPADAKCKESLATGHTNIALLLEEAGKFADAEKSYRRSVALLQGLAEGPPAAPRYNILLARTRSLLAGLLGSAGQHREAGEQYRAILKLFPDSPRALGDLARFLAICPDERLRNPKQAVELARKAVERQPQARACWQTLGIALYRAADWKGAVAALDKSVGLGKPGNAYEWFFLAMARWQLGDKDEARRWFDKAVAWADKHRPKDKDLRRFRAEAAALLGIKETPPQK
jgi:tetratricopeptide (TPR) repeat protein